MGFSWIATASGYTEGTVSTLDCSAALNVAAGDLLVAFVAWEDTSRTITSIQATTGNANTMTLLAVSNNTDNYGAFGYKLSADVNGTATFRLTLSGTAPFVFMAVMQFRPDVGDTISLDTGPGAGSGSAGEGGTVQSGNITTTGTDEVTCGGVKSYRYCNIGTEQIADATADGSIDVGSGAANYLLGMWYKFFTATQSNIHAQAILTTVFNPPSTWICDICSFKSVAAAGGGTLLLLRKS